MSNESIAHHLNQEIITAILNSKLNIPFISDDVEREMYDKIFSVLEVYLTQKTVYEKIWGFLKSHCPCCKKNVEASCDEDEKEASEEKVVVKEKMD